MIAAFEYLHDRPCLKGNGSDGCNKGRKTYRLVRDHCGCLAGPGLSAYRAAWGDRASWWLYGRAGESVSTHKVRGASVNVLQQEQST
jgi:hypothetical protein